MKIKNHISERNIPLTEAEVSMFETPIKKFCRHLDLELRYAHNQLVEVVNPLCPNAKISQNQAICATFRIESKQTIIGVNESGDRICFNGIEIKVENTEDKDGVRQYRMWWRSVKSAYIPYGARTMEGFCTHDGTFQYGTELSDFDFRTPELFYLRMLRLRKISPRQLEKIKEKFAGLILN